MSARGDFGSPEAADDQGVGDSGIVPNHLVAMLHAPLCDAAATARIGRCLLNEIERFLSAKTLSVEIQDAARDRLVDAVFDPSSFRHAKMREDFAKGCNLCLSRARESVRRRRRRFAPLEPVVRDLRDDLSPRAIVRGAFFWRRLLLCRPRVRAVVCGRLQGKAIAEIAAAVGCSRALVNRILTDFHRNGL